MYQLCIETFNDLSALMLSNMQVILAKKTAFGDLNSMKELTSLLIQQRCELFQ